MAKNKSLKNITGLLGDASSTSEKPVSSDTYDSADLAEGQTLCGDLDIRIDRDGTWFYHGSPIGRKELVRLFASVLQRDKNGRFWLITPAEKGEITVEDAPFMAVEMTVDGENETQKLTFRTNIDEIVIADEAHPLRIETDPETQEPSPYILVREGLEARLTRSVFYQLVELGVEMTAEPDTYTEESNPQSSRIFGVWSSGQFFQIGTLSEND